MKCAIKGCNKGITHVYKVTRTDGQKREVFYCKNHAPQGSYDVRNRKLTCGHPFTCIEGENRGRPGTYFCRCCEEEAS